MNNMIKELQGLEEGFELDKHLNYLKTTVKNVPNWKISGRESG